MKKIICIYLLLTLTLFNVAFASRNDFQFQINHYQSLRQAGKTIDVYVRYAIKDQVGYDQYPDYIPLRKITLSYLQPTKDVPAMAYWEIVAAKIGQTLRKKYNVLSGVSVQIIVHADEKGKIYEPGIHGPIYTEGNVNPLNIVLTQNECS